MTEKPLNHPIIFCGAGPGDPELITVKGQRALQQADLVIYAGSLVPEAVLVWCRSGAEKVSSAGMHLEGMVAKMIEGYRAGKRVVRLHTGDPSLYGAIHEQIVALQEQQVPCRVIPGVTAAFGAAAALGLEYTIPEVTQTLILTRMAGRTPVPEAETLQKLAAHGASMAIYLSMALVGQVALILAATYGPESRCVVAYKVSHPQEKVIHTKVKLLEETVRKASIDRHAVILVGPAVQLQDSPVPQSRLYDKSFHHAHR